MTEKKDAKKNPRDEKAGKSRKPWTRPEIRTGKLFEVSSLACGKSLGMTDQCTNNPSSS